jgi:anti-anti-sigma factor
MGINSFQEIDVDGVTILRFERELRGALESHLKDRIDALVGEGRLQILIDLKDMPYIDSSDIGRIIRAHLSARQAGGRVRLCNLSEHVLAALKITKLDTVLEIYDNPEEAMSSIRQSQAGG